MDTERMMQYKTLVLTTYWSGWTKSRCASTTNHKWNTEYLDSAFYKRRKRFVKREKCAL